MARSLLPAALSRTAAARDAFGAKRTCVAIAATLAGVSAPANASDDPMARLVRCGEQSCLLVSGRRDDPSAIVKVNGRTVFVEGGKGWKLQMSLDTLREWAPPHARTIDVALHAPDRAGADITTVDLPIGVLGDTTTLDAIEIRVR